MKISFLASTVTTVLAFCILYSSYDTYCELIKNYNKTMILLPMLVPTITYGFILMYLFGNEGILARIFGEAPFTIYGEYGLFIGYVIYTLPAAFLLFQMHLTM